MSQIDPASLTLTPAWRLLEAHHRSLDGSTLRHRFAEDPDRGTRMVAEAAGLLDGAAL